MSCSRSTWPLMSDDLVTSVLTISLYDVAPSRYTYVSFMLDHAIFTK